MREKASAINLFLYIWTIPVLKIKYHPNEMLDLLVRTLMYACEQINNSLMWGHGRLFACKCCMHCQIFLWNYGIVQSTDYLAVKALLSPQNASIIPDSCRIVLAKLL